MAVAVARSPETTGDYRDASCPASETCNDPAPAIDALAAGRVGEFFDVQPPMGPVSVVLRAPFAAIAPEDDSLQRFRLGAFPCVLALGLLALALAAVARRAGRPPLAYVAAAAFIAWAAVSFNTLLLGHPEEPLAAALALAAMLAAFGGRVAWAGALLGLAVATKQWTVFAALPVLLALPAGSRRRAGIVALGVAALLLLPMLAGNPDRFVHVNVEQVDDRANATPANVWWLAAEETAVPVPGGIARSYEMPDWLRPLTRPVALAVGVGLALLWWRRRPDSPRTELLGLLALILLLRCVLDPYTFSYHHVPFLAALAAWEALGRGRLPLATAAGAAALLVTVEEIAPRGDPALFNGFYLGWTLPLAAYLAWELFIRRPRAAAPAFSA